MDKCKHNGGPIAECRECRMQLALCGLHQTLEPHRELPIETQRGYVQAFSGLTAEQVEFACSQARRQCTFFPKPAELLKLATAEMATQAWLELQTAVVELGDTVSVQFADSFVTRIVRVRGGWQALCSMSSHEFDTWFRKEFYQQYEALLSQYGHPSALHERTRFKGLREQQNGPEGPFTKKHIGCSYLGASQTAIEHEVPGVVKRLVEKMTGGGNESRTSN